MKQEHIDQINKAVAAVAAATVVITRKKSVEE